MSLISNFKTFAVAATMSVVGLSAHAGVLAEASITDGTFSLGVGTPNPLGGAFVATTGTFTGSYDPAIFAVTPTTPLELYAEGAYAVSDGKGGVADSGSGSYSVVGTPAEAYTFLAGLYASLPPSIQDLGSDLLDVIVPAIPDIFAAISGEQSGSISGTFTTTLGSTPYAGTYAFSNYSDTATSVMFDFDLSLGIGSKLGLPDGAIAGTYSAYASISTVPVPASLPLLMAGVGGIAALRRRKAKKAA